MLFKAEVTQQYRIHLGNSQNLSTIPKTVHWVAKRCPIKFMAILLLNMLVRETSIKTLEM